MAGPGFYTGLRLSEGFADIFKMFGIPHFAFYSYEIPRWLGVTQGSWLTKAYRGEYFFHHWNEEKNWNELISAKALPQKLQGMSSLYIHSLAAIDDPIKSAGKELKLTYDLLQTHSQDIFRHVQNEKLLRESFYFRAPEDEFRVAE